MNYMSKVAEMLGVELGERFNIQVNSDGTMLDCIYHFTDTNLMYEYDIENGVANEVNATILFNLLKGKWWIDKKPWRPKDGDPYWRVCLNFRGGEYICRSEPFSSDSTVDVSLLAFGNCFRTREDAEAHKDEIIAKMREVLEG